MPPRNNPLKLNAAAAARRLPCYRPSRAFPVPRRAIADGEVAISQFPNPHGDHFHLGDAVVAAKDATGLTNEAVWNALTRKGLARADYPRQIVLTAEGLGYETGVADEILRRSSH